MLGCGEIGCLLLKRDSRFTVVSVEGDVLHEKGYTTVMGNPTDIKVLLKMGIEKAEVVVIVEEGLEAVDTVRKLNEKAYIIVCDTHSQIKEEGKGKKKKDKEREKKEGKGKERGKGKEKGKGKEEKEEAIEKGKYTAADAVIPSNTAVVEECLSQIQEYEELKRKRNLEELFHQKKKMAIILHDNPDPDCISSALSLQLIAEKMGVASDLFYGGQIGYSENKALIELLNVELISLQGELDSSGYDLIAFVDHSPWDYTSIARDVHPDIVIDHHVQPEYEGVFVDIREDVGATSTILIEYLQSFEVAIDSKLATALFYGLLVDTHDFRRGISPQDIKALDILKDKMDIELLSQVERAGISRRLSRSHKETDFFNVLGEAVKKMEIRENVLFSFVGKVAFRDAVSQSADFLLKMEPVDLVVVYGIINHSVYISARSWDETLHVGKLLREAFHGLGKAGGHPLIGGATIPLKNLPEDFKEAVVTRIVTVLDHSCS